MPRARHNPSPRFDKSHQAAIGLRLVGKAREFAPMNGAPTFTALQEYLSHLGDVGFWRPYLDAILERHELAGAGLELEAGFNPTYPTFLCGDVVVKLFGYAEAWRQAHAAERAAQLLLADDPGILAPRLLTEGRLWDDGDAPWPYMVTTRMSGLAAREAVLSADQLLSLAEALGRQVRRVHGLRPSGVASHDDWQPVNMEAAARRSSLPPHLIAQIDEFLARLEPFDPVFVHGDLTLGYVFVEDGRLAGIIDWGDAMVTDRHYELIQIHRDVFACDKALLRAFLAASDWPVGRRLPYQALGLALHRQAIGCAQHHSMDVFEPIAALLPLQDIATLDELATELFAV